MTALILSHAIAFGAGVILGVGGIYALAQFLCPIRRRARMQRDQHATTQRTP